MGELSEGRAEAAEAGDSGGPGTPSGPGISGDRDTGISGDRADRTGSADLRGPADGTGSVDPAGSVGSVDSDGPGDQAGHASPAGLGDQVGPGGSSDQVGSGGFSDQAAPVGPGDPAELTGPADPADPVPSGFGAVSELDEVVLRRMLHGAVGDLEPSDRTLEHLQRAVPARRARRRQAVVGAAAAALLIGTAVPAFVHVTTSDDPATAFPAIAGHGEQAQGGNGEEPDAQAPADRTVEPTDQESRGGTGEPTPSASPSADRTEDPEGGAATGGVSTPPNVDFAALPVCDPSQLGVVSAAAGAPGTDGKVYGSFRIANVSGADCTVSNNGTVGFTALGAADPLKITVIQHTAGDAAPGLPDPSQEPGTVLLKPSMAYEVQFAWVPADTCPTVAPSPTPTPSPDGSATGGSTGDDSGQSGTDTQSLHQDGSTADGSIAVTHTPETGAPTAETKIENACSGTIYRTGVLATS
ncbi:hypothetical protein [Streptomyces sp. NPDC101178]|uniref:hypothetical protein n=1 Tax=Streptomyces sp. NPDC101178 TaxID=3366124 RepID=UPI003817DC29